jgi:mannose-6-phosphate isomerase-like protein (cupin superfamily)
MTRSPAQPQQPDRSQPDRSQPDRSQPAMIIGSTYVHLEEGGAAAPVPVDERFWSDLAGGRRPDLEQGWLVTQFSFSEDWDSWEMHPEGEELVLLMSGSVDFILDDGGDPRTVELRQPGAFALVPRGAWHRARPHAPTTMLFITQGRGTRHRPYDPGAGR